MITEDAFREVVALLGDQGCADIEWAEGLRAPSDADDFASEAIYVICNSGMKNTIARQIFDRCMGAIGDGRPVASVFGHAGKAAAIEKIWHDRERLLREFNLADDKVEFCARLPWIGSITKWHLAKNFGADVAKPDVHLQRLADRESVTPYDLCRRLAGATGYRVATVDTLLWRACALGIINSRTGEIARRHALRKAETAP